MAEQAWSWDGDGAVWREAACSARVDLACPARGASELVVAGENWDRCALFGVELPGDAGSSAMAEVSDRYARQSELVVSYAMTASQLQAQVMWRSLSNEGSCGLHWVLSLRTPRLDARPLVRLTHTLSDPLAEVLDVERQRTTKGADSAGFTLCPSESSLGAADRWGRSRPMLIYRPHASAYSLVQMVYPGDLLRCAVGAWSEERAGRSVTWDLLDEHLEKGVIRRAQAVVWWVRRQSDLADAIRLYDAFMAAPPPLE